MLRGYNIIYRNGNIDLLSKIGEEISKTKLFIPQKNFSKFYFKSGLSDAEIKIRQKLIDTLVNKKLNKKILFTLAKNKKLVYPLPLQYLKIIEKNGVMVSYSLSSINFFFYIFKIFLVSIFSQFKIIYKLLYNKKFFSTKKYIQFVDLDYKCLPQDSADIDSFNIINWFIKKRITNNDLTTIKHNVTKSKKIFINDIEVSEYTSFFPPIFLLNRIKYFSWIIFSLLRISLEMLFFNWWHILIYNETSITMNLIYSQKKYLAEEYVFSNSSYINRPLWTYEAIRYGSKITLFFYSTNCENFENINGDSFEVIGYNSMNWPNYLVWDNFQFDFIKRVANNKSNIEIVGPIWFQSSKSIIKLKKNKTIAVFDVTPFRDSIFSYLGIPNDYYRSKNNITFLNDIQDIGNKYGFKILFKQKRDIGFKSELKYRNFIRLFVKRNNVELINHDVSASELIECSEMSLSMPFTSPSIIAKEYGFKTAFYDSTGLLNKNDKGAHGIKIISDKSELERWVLDYI
jgi:polysaccharide biosynthesis PFTS motif protein